MAKDTVGSDRTIAASLIGFLLWRRFKIERERSAELQEMVQRLLVEPRLAREVGR